MPSEVISVETHSSFWKRRVDLSYENSIDYHSHASVAKLSYLVPKPVYPRSQLGDEYLADNEKGPTFR